MRINITGRGINPRDLLKIVDKKYEFIARDSNGTWYLFTEKPFLTGGTWISPGESQKIAKYLKIEDYEEFQNSLRARQEIDPNMLFARLREGVTP